METKYSDPRSLPTDSAIAASSSEADRDFNDIKTPVDAVFVAQILEGLSSVLPWGITPNEKTPKVYAKLLADFSQEEVANGFKECAQNMHRVPYPADVIAAIRRNQLLSACSEIAASLKKAEQR